MAETPEHEPPPFLGKPQRQAYFSRDYSTKKWCLNIPTSTIMDTDIWRFYEWLEENMPGEIRRPLGEEIK